MLQFKSIPSVVVRNASIRWLSSSTGWGDAFRNVKSDNAFEPDDDFERRIFGGVSDNDSSNSSFFHKLDRLEKARGKASMDSKLGDDNTSRFIDGLSESYDTLEDGLDAKLKKAATSFLYDEMFDDNYKYRPDVTFHSGMTYDIRDLDLTKPAVQKYSPRWTADITTEEVLKKADFRNVKFLAKFMTEAGIIIKRSKTGISAKAQRKVAREIKTARAFGLMPFISMGTKAFAAGKSMKEDDPTMQFDDFYSGRLVDFSFNPKSIPGEL